MSYVYLYGTFKRHKIFWWTDSLLFDDEMVKDEASHQVIQGMLQYPFSNSNRIQKIVVLFEYGFFLFLHLS